MSYDARLLELARAKSAATTDAPTISTHRSNPLCGDDVHLALTVEDGTIRSGDIDAHGCAILRASATLLRHAIEGMDARVAHTLALEISDMLSRGAALPAAYSALDVVRLFPARRLCARLPWEVLADLADEDQR